MTGGIFEQKRKSNGAYRIGARFNSAIHLLLKKLSPMPVLTPNTQNAGSNPYHNGLRNKDKEYNVNNFSSNEMGIRQTQGQTYEFPCKQVSRYEVTRDWFTGKRILTLEIELE